MHRLRTRSAALKAVCAITGGSTLSYMASDSPRVHISSGWQESGHPDSAEQQFHTSSLFLIPRTYKLKPWKLRNDYPKHPPSDACSDVNAPWLHVDFRKDPEAYANAIRSHCLEGLVQSDFDVSKCKTREWYHAPWLHFGASGRERLRGLTSERLIPPYEFARTQSKYIQIWACGYYDATAASVYGRMWRDPNKSIWDRDVQFHEGSLVFKVLTVDADDEQMPTQRSWPTWSAIIAANHPDPSLPPVVGQRNDFPSNVRLLQIDYAVRDNRVPIGWVFGVFMYDGRKMESNPWYRTTPLGIQWGNDPNLTQERFDRGATVEESWNSPAGEELRLHLGGFRPSWGWNGRLNGPVDNFASACASCHATASRYTDMHKTPPRPILDPKGRWRPGSTDEMRWFQNIPSGTPITRGAVTADYSLQLQLGSKNYEQWKKDNCDLSSRVGDAIAAAIGPHRVQIPVLIPSSSTDSGGSINDPGWNESDYGRSSSYFGRGPAYSARSAGGGAGSKYRPR